MNIKTKRILAFTIDCLFSTVIGLGVPEALSDSFLVPILLFCCYYILLEYLFGKILGKFIMGIKAFQAQQFYTKKSLIYLLQIKLFLSGWQDSNLRPSGPKPDALTGLRYTPIFPIANIRK